MNHPRSHFIIAKLLDRLGNRFHRALHIALDHQRHFADFILLQLRHHLVKRGGARRNRAGFLARFAGAIFSHFTRARFIFNHCENFPGTRRATGTEYFNRHSRPGLINLFATVIYQGAHTTTFLTNDKYVTDFQRAALHQNRGHRPASLIQLGLNHHAFAFARCIGFQLHQFRLQANRLQQIIQPGTGMR